VDENEIEAIREYVAKIKAVVDHQANMECLWVDKPLITEQTLMAALRHLHAVIENDHMEAERSKKQYWHMEPKI